MARLLVLDVIDGKGLYEAECNELDDYYRHLKCDCFDVATRKIGDRYFDMFVDDEGLFKDPAIPSVFDSDMNPMLVGNVVFANHDEYGETTSLSDDDIRIIKESMVTINAVNGSRIWNALFFVEY